MNSQANAIPEPPLRSQTIAPASVPWSRMLYWSVRREIWENRGIYIAPLAVAALFLCGFMISVRHLPEKVREAPTLSEAQYAIQRPFELAGFVIMGITFVVAVFYCLDALHGERRDRSILFWKSLPVSDLTTVLSKASIPLVVLPLVTFAITFVTYWIMLAICSVALIGSGMPFVTLWTHLPLFQMSLMLLYHLVGVHGLWFAPFYGWLLFVSAWARRAPFLWAFIPPLAISVVEKIAFNTTHFAAMLQYLFITGAEGVGVDKARMTTMDHSMLAPTQFLLTPELWVGLAITAAFLAAAIRLRRDREPA